MRFASHEEYYEWVICQAEQKRISFPDAEVFTGWWTRLNYHAIWEGFTVLLCILLMPIFQVVIWFILIPLSTILQTFVLYKTKGMLKRMGREEFKEHLRSLNGGRLKMRRY